MKRGGTNHECWVQNQGIHWRIDARGRTNQPRSAEWQQPLPHWQQKPTKMHGLQTLQSECPPRQPPQEGRVGRKAFPLPAQLPGRVLLQAEAQPPERVPPPPLEQPVGWVPLPVQPPGQAPPPAQPAAQVPRPVPPRCCRRCCSGCPVHHPCCRSPEPLVSAGPRPLGSASRG